MVTSSENISTAISGNTLSVYLNTFRPNTQIYFQIRLNNPKPINVVNGDSTLNVPAEGSFNLSVNSGKVLAQKDVDTPVKTLQLLNNSVSTFIKIYPTPSNFPKVSFSGDTSLVNSKMILSTPVMPNGSYALATTGTNINFFVYSPNNLMGFRRVSDASADPVAGGTPMYQYLEQKDFSVTATSPGIWRYLDSAFNVVSRLNEISLKSGIYYSDGHGATVSQTGNSVVLIPVKRIVDSSWLQRSYKLPILDCTIAEVQNGKAIREWSMWDWAVANKSTSEPLLDKMPLFNDPQNPTTSPIDVCHANSIQYYKPLNVYLVSLRSPSIIVILDSKLQSVRSVLPTDNTLQHFARFTSNNEITALGNNTLGKNSKFLDFTLQSGKWVLKEYDFPYLVSYCGNTNYLDSTHIWLAGGCGPYKASTLGSVFKINGSNLSEVGEVEMQNFTYSYRADVM